MFRGADHFLSEVLLLQPPSPLAQLSSSTEAGTRELDGENHGDDDVVMKMVKMMMMMSVKKLQRKMREKRRVAGGRKGGYQRIIEP